MYRDKDRQREAVREATRRYRLRRKGITGDSVIPEGCDTQDVIPCDTQSVLVERRRGLTKGKICEMALDVLKPEPQSYNPFKVGYVPPVK